MFFRNFGGLLPTTRRYNREDRTLRNHRCENLSFSNTDLYFQKDRTSFHDHNIITPIYINTSIIGRRGRMGSTPASDRGRPEFKSWPEERISQLGFVMVVLSHSSQIVEQCLKLDRNRSSPHPSPLCRSTLH
jgi:hypothetical protein